MKTKLVLSMLRRCMDYPNDAERCIVSQVKLMMELWLVGCELRTFNEAMDKFSQRHFYLQKSLLVAITRFKQILVLRNMRWEISS